MHQELDEVRWFTFCSDIQRAWIFKTCSSVDQNCLQHGKGHCRSTRTGSQIFHNFPSSNAGTSHFWMRGKPQEQREVVRKCGRSISSRRNTITDGLWRKPANFQVVCYSYPTGNSDRKCTDKMIECQTCNSLPTSTSGSHLQTSFSPSFWNSISSTWQVRMHLQQWRRWSTVESRGKTCSISSIRQRLRWGFLLQW